LDLITQGLLGATLAQTAAPRNQVRAATLAGFAAGLLPDADALIRSDADPLLFLEYHRHFSHALAFIPLGALIAALLLWPVLRSQLPFARIYLYAFLGYALAGVLDACTSYGTHLLWPFSDARIAWSIVSIVDPVFSLLLVAALAVGLLRTTPVAARVGVLLAAGYLGLGVVQHERAEDIVERLADRRGHVVERVVVKPSFGNILLWRSLYVSDDTIHADALRLPPWGEARIYPGDTAPLLDLDGDVAWAEPGSRARADLERFAFFSDGLLIAHPRDPALIGDARYAMLPGSLRPLWGIRFEGPDPAQGADWVTDRRMTPAERQRFTDMLLGRDPG
jgi:inner membrane protein